MRAAGCASAWRNSHIAKVAEAKGGASWLREWIQLRVQGDNTSNVAGLLGVRYADTAAQAWRKIRPTALNETLVKLTEGVMIDAAVKKLAKLFEAKQLSVRTPGGGDAVIGALRHRSTWDPRGAVVATGFKNKDGCMCRQCALEAVSTHCPRMLEMQGTQWQRGSTTAWLETPNGWTVWNVERGTWKGASAANPSFCLALHQEVEEARNQDDEKRKGLDKLKVLAYADDVLDLLDEILGELLAETKLCARIPRTRDGLEALGSAAYGEFSTSVGEQQVSQSAEKRAT